MKDSSPAISSPHFLANRRLRVLGLDLNDCIRVFFGGNAVVSVIVLALITYFLFREGAGFFGQNLHNLTVYRRAGLEYVDFMRAQEEDHTALTRYLSDLRLREFTYLTKSKGAGNAEANAALAGFDDFSGRFSDAADPLRALVSDLTETVTAIKTKATVAEDRREQQRQLIAAGRNADAAAITIDAIDFEKELAPVRAVLPQYRDTSEAFARALSAALTAAPEMPTPELQARM